MQPAVRREDRIRLRPDVRGQAADVPAVEVGDPEIVGVDEGDALGRDGRPGQHLRVVGIDGLQAGRGAQAEDQGEGEDEAGVSHGIASWSKDVKMIYTPAGRKWSKLFSPGPGSGNGTRSSQRQERIGACEDQVPSYALTGGRAFVYDVRNAMARLPRDFYEIQERQRRRSLPLFAVVLAFHFVLIGVVGLAFLASFGLIAGAGWVGSPGFWPRFLLGTFAVALVVAVLHFLDARKNGPRFILKRLQAATPDAADRYHVQFLHTLDEIRIAAGLPRVNAYVLPSFAVNSLAVIEDDGTPAVAVTEGLLAEGTRDELQAVAAHELAHIARGDAFYLTLVCSLANLFEKFKGALEPEDDGRAGCGPSSRGGGSFRRSSSTRPSLFPPWSCAC